MTPSSCVFSGLRCPRWLASLALALCSALPQAAGDAALWNDVLSKSCPHEFNPSASAATAAEKQYIGMWVGHEYDASALREADFTTAKVSAFNNQPWAEAVACGKMIKHSSLSAACQSLIRAVRLAGCSRRAAEQVCSSCAHGSLLEACQRIPCLALSVQSDTYQLAMCRTAWQLIALTGSPLEAHNTKQQASRTLTKWTLGLSATTRRTAVNIRPKPALRCSGWTERLTMTSQGQHSMSISPGATLSIV